MATIGTPTAIATVAVEDSPSASGGGGGGITVTGGTNDDQLDPAVDEPADDSATDAATVDEVSCGIESTAPAIVAVVGVHEITSDPVALAVEKTVPHRTMITSSSTTSIVAFSLVATAHPPKLLQVAFATEATAAVVGHTARYTPSIVSPVALQASIVTLPVHVATHSNQTSF